MNTCPECGCDRLVTTRRDGLSIAECDLCGAYVGDDRVIERLRTNELARARGVDPALWKLVEQLRALPGLDVVSSDAGSVSQRSVPHVRVVLTGQRGVLGLENVAKTLALGKSERQLSWGIDVEFDRGLCFTLKPRVNCSIDAQVLARARQDAERLGEEIQRNRALSWWRL
ncbi:MAG: hypothetical protein Fur0037_23370 [Planctomycetota bacterium]